MQGLKDFLTGNRNIVESYPVRPLPGFFRWGMTVAKFATIATGIWTFWQGHSQWWIAVPGSAALCVLYYYRTQIRCPQCHRPMRYREVAQENNSEIFKVHYDCSHCGVTWNPNWTQRDESSPSSS